MSEDFQIQGVQQQSSTLPYALTGAAIGGVGGGLAARHFTKPKYGDIKDIVAETNDKDKFDKKIADAPEEDKKFLEDVREYANKESAFGTEYDTKWEDYKTKNAGTGKKETEEYKKNFVEPENAAKKAFEEKKIQLLNDEISKLKSGGAEVKSGTVEEAIESLARRIYRGTKKLEKIDKAAEPERYAAQKAYVQKLEAEIKPLAEQIAGKLDYAPSAGFVDDAKNQVAKQIEQIIKDRVTERQVAYDGMAPSEHADLIRRYTANKNAIRAEETVIDNNLAQLQQQLFGGKKGEKVTINGREQVIRDDIAQMFKNNHASFDTLVTNKYQSEVNALTKLENLKVAFDKAASAEPKKGSFSLRTLYEAFAALGRGELPAGLAPEVDMKSALEKYMEGLKDSEKAAINKLINGEITKESIDAAINQIKTKQNAIVNAGQAINQAQARLGAVEYIIDPLSGRRIKVSAGLRATEDAIKTELADIGEGTHIVNGKIYDKNHKLIKPEGHDLDISKMEKIADTETVRRPKDLKIEYKVGGQAVELTEEQIKAKAEENIKPVLEKAEETTKYNEAKAAREAAYNGLENAAAKSEDELRKAFHETLGEGITDKTSYQKKQAEKELENLTSKYAEQLKRRFGFAEHAGWKIGAVAAGCAVVFGTLFNLLAPKDQA